ncbi:MAG: hypothetical protein JWO13_2706 [Acidobacteriales bacterium]|nr:hypothetical protein [Terriglobales bacterium]
MENVTKTEQDVIRVAVNFVLTLWVLLLVPWLLMLPISGMAFDAGPTRAAYIFVCSFWTYPVAVFLAAVFKRKTPLIVALPLVNLVGVFLN